MGDPKENSARSFMEKELMQGGHLEESLPVMNEADFRYNPENNDEIPHGLHLNMEKTKEEFEILYTRL